MSRTKYDIELLINKVEVELKERQIIVAYERVSQWKRMMMGLGILEELKADVDTRILWILSCCRDLHNYDGVARNYGNELALDFACVYGNPIRTEMNCLRDSYQTMITPSYNQRAHNVLILALIVDGALHADVDDAPTVTAFTLFAQHRAALFIKADHQLERILEETLKALSDPDLDDDDDYTFDGGSGPTSH